MSFLDKFKKKHESKEQMRSAAETPAKESKAKAPKEVTSDEAKTADKKKKQDTKVDLKDRSGHAAQIIIRPLQTEKITDQIMLNQYTFEVAVDATKSEVKKAVKAMYDVDPVKVRTVNMRGKAVRFGRIWSKRKNWRKAIVTLKQGDKIQVYEGI